MEMSWVEKLEAINALSGSAGCMDVALRMRKPGDWYVEQSVEVKDRDCLEGRYGNGKTAEEAVLDHWEKLTKLATHEYLVVNAMRDSRKAYRWNGFMWAEVREEGVSPAMGEPGRPRHPVTVEIVGSNPTGRAN